MTAPPTIRRAGEDDLEALVRVLVEAFRGDPLFDWFVGRRQHDAGATALFRSELSGAYLAMGECYAAEEPTEDPGQAPAISGTAVWRPAPGAQPTPRGALLRSLPSLAQFSGWRRLHRLYRLIRATESRLPAEAHWYLFLLAVDPARQGEGIGSALLEATLPRVDAQRSPAYLESSKERNVTLYERHGFRVVERLDLAKGGPSLWLMWREAQ
jgi:ribosomal protein S18 acetylase RimI-like enzyme